MQKEGYFLSDFYAFSHFGHSHPAIKLYELLNASAEIDSSSKIVNQGELGRDFFLPPAEEVARTVGVLDRAKGVFAGSLAKLLLGNVALDADHDALFGAFEFAEVIVRAFAKRQERTARDSADRRT